MRTLLDSLNSSIGKKICMAGSGLFMILFLFGHLVGNVLLYVGKDAFNAYADLLNSTDLLILAELALVLILVVHVYTAVALTRENRKARPVEYVYKKKEGKITWASAHMKHTGVIILIFLLVHLWTFKFGEWSNVEPAGNTLYDLVLLRFSSFIYSLGYLAAMLLMGFHLHHAFHSALHTLGINTGDDSAALKKAGAFIAWFLALGFASFPVYFYITSIIPS